LYNGLSAGIVRQIFYATSRLGLYEVFRNFSLKYREVDLASRLFCGIVSGYAKMIKIYAVSLYFILAIVTFKVHVQR
jgi:hypothetical protein